jgi:AraC family transcriptional regulator of adaptative response / DNA-3-methyladenine glycosylase II
LNALAAAAVRNPQLFERTSDPEATLTDLAALPGIGDWTLQYVALRALRDPDAFPASDIGLLRGFAVTGGMRPSAAELLAHSEAWRPWRAYAAQYLWSAEGPARAPGRRPSPGSRAA